jgi:hypothetical protein
LVGKEMRLRYIEETSSHQQQALADQIVLVYGKLIPHFFKSTTYYEGCQIETQERQGIKFVLTQF